MSAPGKTRSARLPGWALDRCGGWLLRWGPPLHEADLGRAAECAATAWLRNAGWRITGRRVRAPAAELDIVAWDGTTLVAVEVKAARVRSLQGLRYRPGQRLDAPRLRAQQRAVRGLARRMGAPGTEPPQARVDLIEVYVAGPWRRLHYVHLQDRTRPLDPQRPNQTWEVLPSAARSPRTPNDGHIFPSTGP